MGVAFSTTAVVLWFGVGAHGAAWVVVGLLAGAALLESAFGLCLGCKVFAVLMRIGLVPETVCAACADVSAAPPRTPARARRGLTRPICTGADAALRRRPTAYPRRGTSSPISTDSSRAQST